MEALGLDVRKFEVDVLRMSEHFKQRKEKNTSKNRAAYVSEMASKFELGNFLRALRVFSSCPL